MQRGLGDRFCDLDPSRLTFVASSGLRLFIALSARAAAAGWALELIAPTGPALSVFEITGALEHLPFGEGGDSK